MDKLVLNNLYEFKKNSDYAGEEQIDRYAKYAVSAIFGGWPGVGAYYLWRRRNEVRKELNKPENKAKRKKLKILLDELNRKLKVEIRKFKKKLKDRKNENK